MNYISFNLSKEFILRNGKKINIKNIELDYYSNKVDVFVCLTQPINSYFLTSNSILIKNKVEEILKEKLSFKVELKNIFRAVLNNNNYFIEFKFIKEKDVVNFYSYLNKKEN